LHDGRMHVQGRPLWEAQAILRSVRQLMEAHCFSRLKSIKRIPLIPTQNEGSGHGAPLCWSVEAAP
jgi:hypothetical protein